MDKSQIVEIKKGQTGTGLLIENDGYMSMDESKRQSIIEAREESNFFVPNPFIVDAVFQKFGIKNANGRIYPENVLKKQVELYQQRIKEKRAYGECYRPEALILTENGWKQLADVKEGDNVLTLNTKTNETEYKPVKRKVKYDYVGNVLHIVGNGINDIVTREHEFPLYCQDKTFVGFFKAEDLTSDRVSDFYIPSGEKDINFTAIKVADLTITSEFYSGKVMCVEVENHTWYVKDNNETHWTKNCNHPSESTIDLGRISHNITELHWEGRTLVGKMELNITEGYRRHGIVSSYGDTIANLLLNGYKIGVSSRGLGSVEQKMGQYIVGDDFELICWDCVSDPSTPNAYISANGDVELKQYIESDESKKDTNRIDEKIKRIESILRD